MKTQKNTSILGSLLLLIAALLAAPACREGTECGPGTQEIDGRCVPVLACGPGTVPGEGENHCIPECGPDAYLEDGECRPIARCAPGTFFDDETIMCRPDGSACASGTTFDAVHMVCRPDATACGDGTHPDGQGACAPNRLPAPDVSESSDPDGAAFFDLPAEGEIISLGGVVDLPIDINGDGYVDQDWDIFAFTASAGDHLRIFATSEGACLPAFILISEEIGDDNSPIYYRASVNPHSVDNGRDFYLPVSGHYYLFVSDIGPILGAVFGAGTLPVGGEDFSYHITVETLPAPTVDAVDSLPALRGGSLEDGRLAFFEVSGIESRDILALESAGEPNELAPSDMFSVLTIFGPDGSLADERSARQMNEDMKHYHAASSAGSYLVMQDFLVSTGPGMDYSLALDLLPVQACIGSGCQLNSLEEGSLAVFRFDTSQGDLIVASGSMPAEAEGRLRFEIRNQDLEGVAICSPGPGESCWRHHYVSLGGWYYLWVEGAGGVALPSFSLDARRLGVSRLSPGEAAGPLPSYRMPEGSIPDGGFARVELAADHVLFLSHIWHDFPWVDPVVSLLNRHLMHIGPPRDLDSENLTPLQDYPMTWTRDEQTVLLRSTDESADLTDATWGLTPHVLSPEELEELSATTIGVTAATMPWSPRVRLYRVDVTSGQEMGLVLEPEADLHPEVWVMARGWQSQGSWHFSSASSELGLIASALADSPGEILELALTAPYDGPLLILVGALGEIADSEDFSMTIALH